MLLSGFTRKPSVYAGCGGFAGGTTSTTSESLIMAFNLNDSELLQLEAKETQAKSNQIGFWQIYEWLADNLVAKGAARTDSTVLWLRGGNRSK
jgi:hypothetical protein